MTATLKKRIEELLKRMERLEEVFIYEKSIDRETYEHQMDKLKEELVLAEMEEHDAKLEAYDIEGVLAFAEHVVCNAARLWMEFSTDQKQRLQTVLFSQGVTFSNEAFGTTVLAHFY